MKIYKSRAEIIIENNGDYFISGETDWDTLIDRDDLFAQLQKEIYQLPVAGDAAWLQQKELLAPIGSQEVWAAGVTYLRSKEARMEESKESGGATFYDKVYDAERPELFFKATAGRVVGPHGKVRIRKDSHWDVPRTRIGTGDKFFRENYWLQYRQRYEQPEHRGRKTLCTCHRQKCTMAVRQ